MLTGSLLAPAAGMAVCGIVFGRAALIGAVFVLGLSASVGRRALDATMQRLAPHARRGQVYASLETRMELVWVLAACLAVAARPRTWVGVSVLAVFLAAVAVAHLRRVRGRSAAGVVVSASLAERLLLRAETLAQRGYHDEAIVLARAATEAARWPAVDDPEDPTITSQRAIDHARRLIDESRPPDANA